MFVYINYFNIQLLLPGSKNWAVIIVLYCCKGVTLGILGGLDFLAAQLSCVLKA